MTKIVIDIPNKTVSVDGVTVNFHNMDFTLHFAIPTGIKSARLEEERGHIEWTHSNSPPLPVTSWQFHFVFGGAIDYFHRMLSEGRIKPVKVENTKLVETENNNLVWDKSIWDVPGASHSIN